MRVLRRTLTGTDDKFFIPFFNLTVHRNSTTYTPRKVTYVSHIKGVDVNREMKFERLQIDFIFAVMFEQRLRDVCL